MKNFLLFTMVVLLSFLSNDLFSQQSKKISLQGFLKDANGKAVADGPQDITFNIYSVATGGVAAWTEIQSINVFGGVYSTHLGSVSNPLDGLNWGSSTYFVGVTVQGIELTPRTELTFAPYSLGSPKAQEVVCSGAVGDVKYSILNPTQFALQNGECWVPMDGRALLVTDKLRVITGLTSVTNAGGLFLRGQEFDVPSQPNHDPGRTFGNTIAIFQDQDALIPSHSHSFSGSTGSTQSLPSLSVFQYFFDVHTGDGASLPSGVNSSSMEEGQGNPDRFMRHNTVNLSGNHSHTVSGTIGSGGQSGSETRPKNLNLWTYIRIN